MSFHTFGRPEILISIRSIEEWNQLERVHFGVPQRFSSIDAQNKGVPDEIWHAAFVDIIDLKEPSRGPLAAVDPHLMEQIAQQCTSFEHLKLSVALGESTEAVVPAGELPETVKFAKMGVSGIRSVTELVDKWHDVRLRLPASTDLVAVAYADHKAANCLSPQDVLATAIEFGLSRILIDTFEKTGRSSLQAMTKESLASFASRAGNRMWWAMAGSLNEQSLQRMSELGIAPNCLGVRGQVCEQGRASNLSIERCREWRNAVVQSQLTRTS